MHDYPSVPNVFRVASSHSVNNDDSYQLPSSRGSVTHGGKPIGELETEKSAFRKDVAPKHQHQQSRQPKPNNLNDAVQYQSTSGVPGGAGALCDMIYTAKASTTGINALEQEQQDRRLHYVGAPMSNNQPAKRLNTTFSMDRNCRNGGFGYKDHYSPYGTLPRSVQCAPSGDPHQQQKQFCNEAAVAGLINTISGSIPSTGVEKNRAVANGNDLNGKSRNSETDFNKLNRARPCAYYFNRQVSPTRTERHKGGYLWILTPVAASISVAIVVAALAGPQWLFTEEKLPNTNYNGTANFNALDDGAFITKYTKSSLWILCTTLQGVETYNCIKIDYFPKEGYQPDPLDSTPAISYTVTKSCPFFLAAGLFLLISFIVFLIPTCSQQSSLYYFSAGIMFIVSGLLMLIGLIVYISILKAEIGSKLRPKSTLQPALFKVTYGQSFFLFVFGFIATEFVGLLNIFLYISLQEVNYYSRFPCFAITNLQEKLKEGPRNKEDLTADFKAPPVSRYGNKRHQVHDVGLSASLKMEIGSDGKRLLQQVTSHACRKHPNATEANFFLGDDSEHRYYFQKPPSMSKCYLHSKNLAKSLNELYTEPAMPPPPPSAIKVGAARTLPRLQQDTSRFSNMLQDFPLTRSVSTTTEIYATDTHRSGCSNYGAQTSHGERRNYRNMATNTHLSAIKIDKKEKKGTASSQQANEYDYDMEAPQRLCGLKRGTIRKTKDELFQEFCKRAGMRPKPKNIYYITNEEEESDEQKRRDGATVPEALDLNVFKVSGNEMRGSEEEGQYNENDEGECKRLLLQDDEEHIYVVDDNSPYLLAEPARNIRRASMYAEPTHMRKLSSDLSLHTLYPPDKPHQMSLLDLEKCDYNRNAIGGSEDRLCQDYNSQLNGSRTLPHSFTRRSTDSLDSMGSASLHASTNALQSAYCVSRKRLTSLMLQHQQQQEYLQQRQHQQQWQQKNHFAPLSRDVGLHHSAVALNRTSDHPSAPLIRPQHHQPPVVNPLASSEVSSAQQTSVQWPSVIPSSPSNFISRYQLYTPVSNSHTHELLTRSTSGGASGRNGGSGAMGPQKFQRGYAFDEQRRSSSIVVDAFDLDEIERERRRSHASLFSGTSLGANGPCNGNTEHYDLINGTAV